MGEPGINQRRFPRVPLRYVMLVSRVEDRVQALETSTRSIGLGGCSFEFKESIEPETMVKLFLAVGFSHMMVRARVVYSRALDGGSFEVGVEFVEVSERDLRAIARHFNWDTPWQQ